VKAIVKAVGEDIPVQLVAASVISHTIERYLDDGISFVIIGTAAVKTPGFLHDACYAFPGHIMVGLDAREGKVAVDGWSKMTGHDVLDLALKFQDYGVEAIIHTDIGRDGMLTGVNIEATVELARALTVPVIASGGITNLDDVRKLCAVEAEGIPGAITGRALYEGTLDFAQAQKLADELSASSERATLPVRFANAMGLATRIIPCLDVTAGRVVKGVNFVGLRDAGDPVEVARRYDEQGADELTFLDITASSDGRDTIVQVVEAVAEQVFIPLTVGGGVRSVADIRRLLNAGADKVSINTAAGAEPRVRGGGRRSLRIPVHRGRDRCPASAGLGAAGWEGLHARAPQGHGLDAVEWGKRMQAAGAGEILLTSMDRDGTKQGFDVELTRAFSDALDIPVIASGGVGGLQDLVDGVKLGGPTPCSRPASSTTANTPWRRPSAS